jgi:hypothetical protein
VTPRLVHHASRDSLEILSRIQNMDKELTNEERFQMHLDLCDRIYLRLKSEGKWEETVARLGQKEPRIRADRKK